MSQVADRVLAAGGLGLGAASFYRYSSLKLGELALPRKTLYQFPNHSENNDNNNNNSNSNEKKHVLVIGGGVVGVSAAYKLARAGHTVALLEPRSAPGQECSACAAGGMQKSNPTVDKDSWLAVLKCIVPLPWNKQDFRFFHIDWLETVTDPFFLRWLVTFTQTSLFPGSEQQKKQVDMLDFTNYAVNDMVSMMEDPTDNMSVASGYNTAGSLSLSYESVSNVPNNPSQSKRTFEPSQPVSANQVLETEPSVRFQKQLPTSGKFENEARAASSERFTREIAKRCKAMPNVTFLYKTKVQAIAVNKSDNQQLPRISQIQTNRGIIDIPENTEVVVAAGAWTPHILALMDTYAPVYPLKGYALSINAQETSHTPSDLPSRIVNDKFMYTSRLGNEIKITSIGEFSGWSTVPAPKVDLDFRMEAIRQFPQLKDSILKAKTRCGHRPFVSDGLVLLGRCSDTHENLYVSCGPGSNGWKLAFGSGEIIQRLVSGQTEEQISQDLGFNVQTFSPAGRVRRAPFFAKLCRVRWGI